MTQKFVLQKQKGQEKALIVWQLFHKRKLFNYGTGISIMPSDWDSEEEAIKKNRKGKNGKEEVVELNKAKAVDLNGQLARYSNVFKAVEAKLGGLKAKLKNVSAEEFKEAIDKELIAEGLRNPSKQDKIKQTKTFLDYFTDFLRKDNRGKSKTLSTIQQYKSSIEVLREYNPDALLNDINKDYFEKLKAYLYAKNYELNSVVNMVGRINAVLNWCVREGILKDLSYKSFEIGKQATTQIALTIEEIEKIRKVNLDKESLIQARDLFIFQCYTGIRFSDLNILNKEYFKVINGANILIFHNVKTTKKIEVPLFSIAFQIAKKYDFNFQSLTLNLKAHIDKLRKIAALAGLTDKVEVVSYPKGKKELEFFPKNELIGTHTARRSFITYAHTKELNPAQISMITGQTLATVMKYIKPSVEDKQSIMSKLTEMSAKMD